MRWNVVVHIFFAVNVNLSLLVSRGGLATARVLWDDQGCFTARGLPGNNTPCGIPRGPDEELTPLKPGPITLFFQEIAPEADSIFRVALSRDGVDEFDGCLLLDNIPHNNDDTANQHLYQVTVQLPDVNCKHCALQVVQVLTNPGGECEYQDACSVQVQCQPPNCPINYFSCADISITSPNPDAPGRNDDGFQCPTAWQDTWNFTLETPNVYSPLNATWSIPDPASVLVGVPAQFTTPVDCSETAISPPPEPEENGGLSTGQAIGITFGVLFVVFLSCCLIYWHLRKRSEAQQEMLIGDAALISQAYQDAPDGLDGRESNKPLGPLPAGWEEFFTDDGIPYYFCEETSQTQWDRPAGRKS